ncbi:MAG: hypothetical protein GY715_20815, partial [Planctomycetes bacterium]|nr:hypothetical protein [Planctomycetota bacterium]
LLAGAVVTAAITTDRRGPRNLAMIACMAMCLLGPALGVAGVMRGVDAMALINLSPIMAVRSLGVAGGARITAAEWQWISLLFAAAAAAWTVLIAWTMWRDRARRLDVSGAA